MTELPELQRVERTQDLGYQNRAALGDEVDLRELYRKLWRQRRILLGVIFSITALVAIIVFQITPQYTARALVIIEPRTSQVVDIEAVLSGLPPDQETVNSEIAIIQSSRLVGRLVDKLALDRYPEFNPTLREKSVWAQVSAVGTGLIDLIKGSGPEAEETVDTAPNPENEEAIRSWVIGNVASRIGVSVVGRSWVIEISFSSQDNKLASRIVNELVDFYLVDQLEAKYEATKRATEWLNDRLSSLRIQVEASEKAVEEYRRQAGLVEGRDSSTIAGQQLTELNSQLIIARSAKAEAEARLQQVERLLGTNRGVASVGDVMSSALIQQLLVQEAQITRQIADLSGEFGPRHPKMINMQAQLRDTRIKIDTEVQKVVDGLRGEVEVKRARVSALEAEVTNLQSHLGALNAKGVEMRALERDAEANRTLYENFLNRFKEISGQQDIQTPDARVIAYASTPTGPSSPRTKLILAVTLVVATALGISLVLLIEHLDAGFRSSEQIESMTGVAALGLIPSVSTRKSAGGWPFDVVLNDPISAYAESIRNLHVSLMLSDVDKPPRTVLISSSMPEEGKTTISLSLARSIALSGKKTLLIDCDLRNPNVHTSFQLTRTPGLVELLAHQADIDVVMQADKSSGLHVITSGEHVTNSSDLLSSEQMRTLLGTLRKSYDMIVIDSPPVLAVSDSRVLARLADKTIFVVQWVRTRRETANLGIKQVVDAGADLAGIVLSHVDVKKHATYGFADSGRFHGNYTKYYTT